MNNSITRERLAKIKSWRETYGAGSNVMLPAEEAEELARIALAAMDSEPVAYTDERNLGYIDRGRETAYLWGKQNSEASDVALYRHAQPAPERDQVRREHAEWSQATFGNVGPVGPLKHLSKEALEAAAEPGDLSEWADIQFLLWDAQRRAGITDEQITQAMIEKLAVNKQREWPEPKDGEPRLHIKAQPAPVVLDEVTAEYCPALVKYDVTEVDEAWARGFNACRAAMLQASPVCTCPSGDGSLRWPCPVHPGNSPAQSYCCPAQNSVSPAQDGNSPATSDNWQVEAEKLAEMHGMSFVLFRHGEAPQCADPTKVVISFTDKGLGHDTLPAALQEGK